MQAEGNVFDDGLVAGGRYEANRQHLYMQQGIQQPRSPNTVHLGSFAELCPRRNVQAVGSLGSNAEETADEPINLSLAGFVTSTVLATVFGNILLIRRRVWSQSCSPGPFGNDLVLPADGLAQCDRRFEPVHHEQGPLDPVQLLEGEVKLVLALECRHRKYRVLIGDHV